MPCEISSMINVYINENKINTVFLEMHSVSFYAILTNYKFFHTDILKIRKVCILSPRKFKTNILKRLYI